MMFLKAVSAGRRRYPIITDGLKLYLDAYNLDSYSGSGGTWTDLSNSGYNITITGPTWTESGGRRYFEFDGVNDYMEGNSDTSIFDINTSGNTWSFWIYWVTSPALLDGIAVTYLDTSSSGANLKYSAFDHRNTDAGTGTGAGYCYSVYKASPNIIDKRTTYAETVPTGVWTQITTTFIYSTSTSATFKIYKNGSEVTTENHTITGTTWDALDFRRPFFGAVNLDGTMIRFNNIRLGEILQYNRPLSATEISNNYNSTKTNYGL
jgi:hypothetical protein